MNPLTEKFHEVISHMKVKPDFTKDQFSHLEEAYINAMINDEKFHDIQLKKWNIVDETPQPTQEDMLNNGMRRTYKKKK